MRAKSGKLTVWPTELQASINPGFIIILTPLAVGFFAFLRRRRREPSTPGKIAWGILISALAWVVRMIYIGDGETDVPAMKMIKYQGGTAIAVYGPEKENPPNQPSPRQLCEKLIDQLRADFIAPANYLENGRLDRILKTLIDKLVDEEKLKAF